MFNPTASAATNGSANKRAISEVTKWVNEMVIERGIFSVDEFQVMVTEIQCNEPDCVPIETLVIIVSMNVEGDPATSSKGSQKWANKIMMPVAEVSKADVEELINGVFPIDPPNNVSDISLLTERNSRVELFGSELSALISKYQPTETNEDATAEKLLLIQVLQTHMDALRRDMTKAETPVPPPAIPAPEPVRVVTTVIMKSNVPKPVPAPVASVPISSVPSAAPMVAASISPPISVRMANKSSTPSPSAVLDASIAKEPVLVSASPATEPATAAKASTTSAPATAAPTPIVTYSQPVPTTGATIAPRHKKGGTRPRGCPCCDPDNLDNIIDSMMFSHYPQT